ncbi:hypothetical protein AVEN_163872-1 [Araneus ventricosus]|uniref:DUF4817 domain-containing protein n=1 Tax=Araneus ventricosus TaxID=182803 RepID=A0A4Y2H7D6_ARAVE|nr:hypothetical protein AVEN_163872-1 [Araneus ventricosus]
MYSIEQLVFLVLVYYRLEHSPTATRRSFQNRFNVPKGPDAKTIRKPFAKFKRTGSVDDNRVGNVGPRQTVITSENVAKVHGIVQQIPRNTVRRIASETGLKRPRMDWPPYSPYLTPCDYFLWGALKDTVYGNYPSSLDELESGICVACNSISFETLKDVMSNFILRLRHLIFSNGEHFEIIVF